MTELLTLNKPNKNGRTYPTEVVREALARYKAQRTDRDLPFFVQSSFEWPSHNVNLEMVVGQVEDVVIEGDRLLGNVRVFPGKEEFLACSVRPSFIAQLSEEGVVSDATLVTFAFTNDPS